MTADEAIAEMARTSVATPEMQAILYEAGLMDIDIVRFRYSLNADGRIAFMRAKVVLEKEPTR